MNDGDQLCCLHHHAAALWLSLFPTTQFRASAGMVVSERDVSRDHLPVPCSHLQSEQQMGSSSCPLAELQILGEGVVGFGACDSLTQRFVPVLDCSSRSPLLCPSAVPAQRVVENPSLLYIPSQTNFNHFLTAAGAMCGHVILLSHSLLVLHQLSFLWPMFFFSPIFLCTCWNGPISAPRRGEQPFDGCGRWHLGMGALEGDFSLYIRESIKPHLPKKN